MHPTNSNVIWSWFPAVQATETAFHILSLNAAFSQCMFVIKTMLYKYILLFFLFTAFATAQQFTKVTAGPLVNTAGDSRSVNWVDVNNDGFIDCMITNGPSGGQDNTLYLNNGAGNFTAVINDSIVSDGQPSDGATLADCDNDGDADCFVVNWYNVNKMFYLNNGNGSFTKIDTGIMVNEGGYSETASWGDYDKDGLLDLYVTNSAGAKKNFLYHNAGGNYFTKITTGAVVNDTYASRSVNWTDIDMDGDLDIFVSNETSQSENIYRNDGNGVFTKLSTGPLLTNAGNTMSSSWGDYDNDGDLDVFLCNDLSANALFRNNGNFSFTKITNDTVAKGTAHSFSSAWSDVDNDGDLDLFVTNAFTNGMKQTGMLYLNNSGSFTRVQDAPTTDSAWTYGCAFGDYDNDGFEDLAVATCRYNNVDPPDFLYHNNGNGNHWLTLRLTGTVSNRSAIGAKVWLKATINNNPVWQFREISAQSSYCGENDLRVHFGLGNATVADSVKIEWPLGIKEYFTSLPADHFLDAIEGSGINAISNRKGSAQGFQLFPNPAEENITLAPVEESFSKGDIITLSDASGKIIMADKISSQSAVHKINLRAYSLRAGVYFISLQHNGEKFTQKIILK